MKALEFAIHNMQETMAAELPALDLDRLDLEAALGICARHRRIGCGFFLAEGDRRALFEGLYRSAYTYLYFLGTLSGRPEPVLVARGRSAPMTDALAAGQIELARRIDALLPARPVEGLEDEEDFAWYAALHAAGLGRLDAAALRALADGMEASGSDFLSPRGKLLGAMADADPEAFGDALGDLTRAWRDAVEEERDSGITDREADLTEWNLFLEGAAVVRAAQAVGVRVERFYPFVPPELLGDPPEGLGEA